MGGVTRFRLWMMDEPLGFERGAAPEYGVAASVAPDVRRLTARNPGPFTFHGTNTYLVGVGRIAVIDPGPDDDEHLAAILRAVGEEPVTHILITHAHRDHSALAPRLKDATGALTVSGRRRSVGPAQPGDLVLDAGGDTKFSPDIAVEDAALIGGDGWHLKAIATPGHASDHFCFAVVGTDLLFSGDHVMGWSTTVVAPPDGNMADYMASLDRLLARPERRYLPGHGEPIADAPGYVRGLRNHRRMREAAILDRLGEGEQTIPALVAAIYRDTDPRLHGAAALSVLAHLEDLVARGKVRTEELPRLDGRFRRV